MGCFYLVYLYYKYESYKIKANTISNSWYMLKRKWEIHLIDQTKLPLAAATFRLLPNSHGNYQVSLAKLDAVIKIKLYKPTGFIAFKVINT